MVNRIKKKTVAVAALIISAMICVLIGLSACGSPARDSADPPAYEPPIYEPPAYDPDNNEGVAANDFHTPLQYAYINDDYNNISVYAKGNRELSRPDAIVLDYSDIDKSTSYSVEYADNAEFNDSTIVNGVRSQKYEVYNLMLGQELYWRAAASEAGLKNATARHMTVASQAPRNLYIDGVTNVRDIGGYGSYLVGGAKIRQGLLFRGAALDSYSQSKILITDKGKAELLRLGVKQEIDLRDEKRCNGPYVDGIEYNAISIPKGTESTRFEEFAEEYKSIFTMIANADQAPIYLHCSAGADRTGISAFMLLMVCGVSYEDAARDYLFTNFSTHGARSLKSEFDVWYKKLDAYEGSTKADKAKNWLISKGVSEKQVEHIREIFVEGYIPAAVS